MTAKQALGVLACVCLAMVAPRGAAAQIWLPAACDIKPGHNLVNSGMASLKSATSTKFADQRTKDLKEAERDLTQAVATKGQEKNPAAWYYLARYYVMVDDLAGADSAFTKALDLAPKCQEDISLYRRQAWVPVFNGSVKAWQAGNTDSAIAGFRRANQIYQGEPMGFMALATLFIDTNQIDSAAKYFRLAVPAASDPKYAKDRRDALFNVARVYHSAKRYDEAAAAYKQYLAAYPKDVQAMAGLAGLYLQATKVDSAMALYRQILALADSARALDLFGAGQGVLSAIPLAPDTAALSSSCRSALRKKTPALPQAQLRARCQPVVADSMQKFHALADGPYRLSAQIYEAGLAKNPYYRDALYNLGGISFLIGDTAQVLPLARRLYAIDPMNRSSIAKVIGAWQLKGNKDSVLYYLQVADTGQLPVEVTVSGFTVRDSTATIDGLFTNGRPKPSTPMTVVFDFLNEKGDVVASVPDTVAAIDGSANQSFKLKAKGAGIAAWRYKRP